MSGPSTLYHGSVPGWDRIPYRRRRQLVRAGFYVVLAVAVAVIVFPLFWMFSTALRPNAEIFTKSAILLPQTWSLEQYASILGNSDFLRYYQNSLIVALGVVLVTTTFATLGGYGLARISIPYKTTFARGILFGYMFPAILIAIPMFIVWRELGIINSYLGLILAETAISLPFSLWLMWKFFQTVPFSLEEAAQTMGASRFRAFYEVALPIAKPGMIAVAIFSYAISWNAYTMPRILLPDSDKWVLTVGIYSFTQQNSVMWGEVMAASSMVVLPAFVFVYFLQKYLLRGFEAGGFA